MEAAELAQHLGAGPLPQVIRVAENDAGAGRFDLGGQQRLHTALRTDGHERRKIDVAVRRAQNGATRVTVLREDAERETFATRLHDGHTNIASPYEKNRKR